MLLCVDIGNTNVSCAVFEGDRIIFRFTFSSKEAGVPKKFGAFVRALFKSNNVEFSSIKKIAISSVVPGVTKTVSDECENFFKVKPFVVDKNTKTGLTLDLPKPEQLGADRIVNAVAVVNFFPNQNSIIVDIGTATTFCALKNTVYLGGVIIPGPVTAMRSLNSATAQLPLVDIIKPSFVLGKDTEQNIQSGIYYGHLGALKTIISKTRREVFSGEKIVVIGTGGLVFLFKDEGVFTHVMPDLMMHGLRFLSKANSLSLR